MIYSIKNKKVLFGAVFILATTGVFFSGWTAKGFFGPDTSGVTIPLRLGGFQLVHPLLVCDVNPDVESSAFQSLKNKITDVASTAIQNKSIETASIYFRDLTTGGQVDINKDETFFPSSLRKVPMLIAILKAAEEAPDVLNKISVKVIGEDQNVKQEIKPREFAEIGKKYTIGDLLEKMIKYSDNNAAAALVSVLGEDSLKSVFSNLQIPFPTERVSNITSPEAVDFITSHQFSFFFRVLYNSTYLSSELSEQALRLLTETDFTDGLAAGVPGDIKVAHKFGLITFNDPSGVALKRELHDCGIIYHQKNPYILCVMTKSRSDIPAIKNFIKDVSKTVYEEVDKNK